MPALLANVPEGIVWGRVTAYVTSFVADGGTELPDGTPDAIPLDGTITLTPTVGVMVFPTLTTPQQAVIQSLVCPVIGGVLYAPGTTPENVVDREPGVILVASEQPLGLPDRVQYNVTWALEGARVSPPTVTIDVPSQGTVDLATVIPATPGPGKVIVVSTVDRERAEAARLGAEAARDAAEGSAQAASGSAGVASVKAGEASGSAVAAATSAGNAAASAEAAETARDQAVATTYTLRGPGRPDTPTTTGGVITSSEPVGTLYISTDGAGVGAWQWQKTGASKWVVTVGDTGLRRVGSLVNSAYVNAASGESRVFLRRVGAQVTLSVDALDLVTSVTEPVFMVLPSGFRGGPMVPRFGVGSTYEAEKKIFGEAGSGNLNIAGGLGSGSRRFYLQWAATSEWPSTLPGVAA